MASISETGVDENRWAVIGLGNPGSKYEKTRHNVGFWTIDFLAEKNVYGQKFDCSYVKVNQAGLELYLIKPQLYMNLSGEAAAPFIKYFRIPVGQVIVVHDEVDLPFGALKAKVGGGSAGHNGIENLVPHLGTPDFIRIRVGVGRPQGGQEGRQEIANWVLSAPKGEELEQLRQTADLAGKFSISVISDGLTAAQQKFSRKAFPAP